MEPQGISLLRIGEQRVEQARGRNDITALIESTETYFYIKEVLQLYNLGLHILLCIEWKVLLRKAS